MDFTNYLTMRSSNVATLKAAHLSLSTLTGSTLSLTTHITAPMAMYSTMMGSTIAVSTLTGSTLFGSTLVMSSMTTSFLTLSTLMVSSINSNVPGSFSTLTVSSLVSVSTITTSSINVAGNIVKLGTTSGNDVRVEGGTATNSGYVNFVTGGTSRGYIGNASATDVDVVAQNGAKLNFYTGGTNRIMINTAGQTDFYGNVSVNNGVGGTLTKFGSTAGYYGTFTGGTADNSPFLEFWANGSRRCYMGNANTTEVQFASENGAQINFLTGGTSRMIINTAGNVGVSGRLVLSGSSVCEIYNGNIDTYNPTGNNNLMIRSWWGIGFPSYDNIVRIGMDTRSGSADFAGDVRVGNNITMQITKPLYLYYISATNHAGFITESSGNMNLYTGTGGVANRLRIDVAGNVNVISRELRIDQLNSGHGQIRFKSGNTNIATMFHCNGTEMYFLNTNNGDWEGGYNGLRPLKYSLTSGLVTMDNGLTVNNTITVASGNNSMTYYGPNTTWSAYLAVGSGTDKSNGNTAQVISTNGNLHLDGGNSLDMYYGYYTWARSTPNVHRFYGSVYIDSLMSIGTTVMRFPLYITSGRAWTWYLGAYLHSGGAHMHNQTNTWQVSIWTDSAIVTTHWFGTVSDQRIKKNIQPVGAMLETINRIEIVSFDFIDEPNNKRDECGIIAQQLESVFPNAVDTSTGVIPCYLKFATSQYLVDDDVHILFDYDHNDVQQQFKVGDKIKIHAGQNTADKGSHHVVVKSIIDGGFITAPWKDYDENDGVFLHGKEVDDFRNVDKEQLGVLALKGVQELSSSVVALQAANAATSSQMAMLHGTCASLQQENAQLKSQVESLSSSHAALLAWAQAQGFSG